MRVKVWNDNVHPFKQVIGEEKYDIQAGKYIELDIEDANKLVKTYSPVLVNYDNKPKPESYKMLRIDESDLRKISEKREVKNKSGSYLCQACGYIASNKYELNGHVLAEHKESFDDIQEATKAIQRETKKKA